MLRWFVRVKVRGLNINHPDGHHLTRLDGAHLDGYTGWMPNYRDYKKFSEGQYYHVFNRGVARQDIFLDSEDFRLFLYRLKEQVSGKPILLMSNKKYQRKIFEAGMFEIISYCLMPNHFHLVIKQLKNVPISELMGRVITGYSKVFNKKYERVGTLFQDQFKAVLIENDEQLTWLTAYVHQNPTVANLVETPEEWEWSSYRDYMNFRNGTLVNKNLVLSLPTFNNDLERYKNFVIDSLEPIKNRKIAEHLLLDE